MATFVLFHHVHGLTGGMQDIANRLRTAGHIVHAPELFDGQIFDTIDAGLAYVQQIGVDAFIARGVQSAQDLVNGAIVAGFSLGALPAQYVAQTHGGVRGAVLMHACVPAAEFGEWPIDLPVQIHAMADDPYFVGDGDREAAQALVASALHGVLYEYPGNRHLFTDNSLTDYDALTTEFVVQRTEACARMFG
jgi:dienelactone hydrolase